MDLSGDAKSDNFLVVSLFTLYMFSLIDGSSVQIEQVLVMQVRNSTSI